MTSSTRLTIGTRLDSMTFETLSHGTLRVPSAGLIHLQFRRFAGCPVCNLHLKTFATGIARLERAGVTAVAFFHSSAKAMRPYQGDLPFPTVADPQRRWYRQFAVEQSLFAIVRPQVMWSAVKGLVTARSNPLAGGGGQTGLPADFLIGPDARLLAVHYGQHADDQWSLDEVLGLAAAADLRSIKPTEQHEGRLVHQ
jgi:peroxiredoxin